MSAAGRDDADQCRRWANVAMLAGIHSWVENQSGYLCTINISNVNTTNKNVLMKIYCGISSVDHDAIILTTLPFNSVYKTLLYSIYRG